MELGDIVDRTLIIIQTNVIKTNFLTLKMHRLIYLEMQNIFRKSVL